MSTKIYEAWRLPSSRLNDFLDAIRPQMFARVLTHIDGLMACVKDEAVAAERAKRYRDGIRAGVTEAMVERVIRAGIVLDLVRKADREHGPNGLLLDCGLNVWLHRRRAYVVPWGLPITYADLVVPEWAEEYAYWDNTDRPESIAERAWQTRRRTWAAAALDDWDAHRLTYYVVDMSRTGLGYGTILRHYYQLPAPEEAAVAAR